jgi:glutamine amidotransferase
LPPEETIPHMGWNLVRQPEDMVLFEGLGEENHFYFAHSYYADVRDKDAKIAYTEYGIDIPAAVQKNNIYGVQFHPEKSGPIGLEVLRNFERICKRRD